MEEECCLNIVFLDNNFSKVLLAQSITCLSLTSLATARTKFAGLLCLASTFFYG